GQLTPRSQTSAQNGATRATASSDAGSSRRNAKSAEVGTLQVGSDGAVSRSVSRTYAPRSAGRQWAPVSSSIVIGASWGTSGASGTTTFWRRVGAIGTWTSARAAVRPMNGPVARTTIGAATAPSCISTAT